VESGGNCTGSTEKLGEQLESFLEIVESALMIRGVLYLIPEQVPLLFGEGEVPDRARWVRNLFGPPAIIEGRPARFWQYHNHAWVSGVREPVDVNVFDGSLAELSAWAFDSRMPERLKPQPDSTLKFH
jgi:GH25 family lysozyme M1 (1,4-beta-N-acetylmuramidase)